MTEYAYEWPEHVSLDPNPRATLRAIIPNLDRRTERWEPCYEKLTSDAQFPASQIHRFSAFDYKNYPTLEAAKEHAARHFRGLPPLLTQETIISSFCWLFTWYAMMMQISAAHRDEYFMMLLDDCTVTLTYNQLRHSIDVLNANGEKATVIQLSRNPRKMQCRRMIPELDIWQYGLCGRSDAGFIVNPVGAAKLAANANEKPYPHVPASVLERLSSEANQGGHYSLSARYEQFNGGGAGAAKIFIGGLELQDRLGSVGY